MKRKKKGLWLHPPKRVKLSKDQNESTESRDSTTNTQTTTPVNPPNYRFYFTIAHGVVLENGKGGSSFFLRQGKSS
jgi:hypothetical protein